MSDQNSAGGVAVAPAPPAPAPAASPPAPAPPAAVPAVPAPSAAPPAAQGVTRKDVEELLAKARQKTGGDDGKVLFGLAKKALEFQREALDARAQAVPAGHVVLPAAEAQALKTYRALGAPEAIRDALQTLDAYKAHGEPRAIRDALQALEAYRAHGEPRTVQERLASAEAVRRELADRDREEMIVQLAAALRWNADVLRDLVKPDMRFEPTTAGGRNGKQRPTVKVLDADPETGKPRERLIDELIQGDWQKYLPALMTPPPGAAPAPAPAPVIVPGGAPRTTLAAPVLPTLTPGAGPYRGPGAVPAPAAAYTAASPPPPPPSEANLSATERNTLALVRAGVLAL